jgi:glycosyltransferase involved in cell wall biosynthesis
MKAATPSPIEAMTEPRVRVLAVLPGLFPSTVVNVAKPLLRLHETGAIDLELSFQFAVRRRQIERAAVLVMCHTIDPAHTWILDAARDSGTPLLYDIDENLFEPPAAVSGLDYQRAPERKAALGECLRQASLVRTYAPALKRYLDPFNPNVVRVDGPIDWRLVPEQPPPRRADRVRLVYATSRLRDSVGVALIAPLRRVLGDHPDVEVTVWGPRLAELDGHPRVRYRAFVRDYDRYFEQFAREGFDIGLAPMPEDLFHQCKTATKFREYAACRIAGIYSDTEIYRDCVADGVTGLLAPAQEDAWVAAMGRLIRDAALRGAIQERAYAEARERYAPGRMEQEWLAHINDVRQQARAGGATDVEANLSGRADPQGHRVRASPVAIAVGIARQTLRYASRVPALVRSGGLKDVWSRTRAQLAGFRQLMAWEVTLWRLQRHRSRMP